MKKLSSLLFTMIILVIPSFIHADESFDHEKINHYTDRTIVSATRADPSTAGTFKHIVRLDDGSVWWGSIDDGSLHHFQSLAGKRVRIQYDKDTQFGTYDFVSPDHPNEAVLQARLFPYPMALRVEKIAILNDQKLPTEYWFGKADFKTTAEVTLSDGSQWMISSVKRRFIESDPRPPTVAGASVQLVWLRDENAAPQPAMVEHRPGGVTSLFLITE